MWQDDDVQCAALLCAAKGCVLHAGCTGLFWAVRVAHVVASSMLRQCAESAVRRVRTKSALWGAVVLLSVSPKQYGMVQ